MNNHIAEELPRLLTGEATHDTVLAAAAHLRSCPDCYEELVSAVVAHASLSSAQRYAPEIVMRDALELFGATEGTDGESSGSELPDLSSVFAQAHAEATSPAAVVKAKARSAVHHPKRTRYLAVAAAAAVLIGGGAAAVALSEGGSSEPGNHQVALTAYDRGKTRAAATISNAGKLTIDAATLPHVTGRRYEVWLTDANRSSMKPVGWLDSHGKATLSVPSDLVGTYSYIEVSQQKVSSDSYAYSGLSVLRGKYTV